MSITLQSNPGTYYSAHGDLLFIVCDIVKASDPVTYQDYRYVCDVYIGSDFVVRLKAYPRPDNKMGVFNVGNIIRDYVAANFNPTANQLRAQQMGTGEFFITATMKFGDEYNFVLNTNLLTDSARIYFNHYNGRLIGGNTSLSPYLDKPITVRPSATPVNEDAKFCFVPYFSPDSTPVGVTIRSYTDSGSLVQTYTADFTPSAGNNQQLFNVSPVNLNIVSPGLIVAGLVSYYTVEFEALILSGSYRVNVTDGAFNATICGTSPATRYTRAAYGSGVILYSDAAATIPITGYNFVADAGGTVRTIDSSTGLIGGTSGPAC